MSPEHETTGACPACTQAHGLSTYHITDADRERGMAWRARELAIRGSGERKKAKRLSVWLVMANTSYEGSDVVSIHATPEGAEKYRQRVQRRMDKRDALERAWVDDRTETIKEPKGFDDLPRCDSLTVSSEWPVSR